MRPSTTQETQARADFLDKRLGAEPIDGIEEDGFLKGEVSQATGEKYRWTGGTAQMKVPLVKTPRRGRCTFVWP